jgi:hypothetical protein
MTTWIEIGVVVAVLVALIVTLGAKDRHSEMTEEEFEAEAKRVSMMGAGVMELHKMFQPARVKQIVAEKQRAKQEMNVSGDPPHDDEIPDDQSVESESAENESK